jgi:hypothetical protein
MGRSLLPADNEYFPEYWLRRVLEALRIKPHGRTDKILSVCLLVGLGGTVAAAWLIFAALSLAWAALVIYVAYAWLIPGLVRAGIWLEAALLG